ncbi:MAG: class I SAM-dependent methyltransferase, partial [Acidobacteria bacterium]|nr:class I SAM-dependent methyltransferase [Acidobacteriota bacterium]
MSEKIFNPLEHPVCLEFPLWLEETAWAGHIPFAMFITSAFRPRVFVELGTFRGASYCAFCQAVKSVKTKTKCFAVDTWQGDAHAGQIEREVLVKLKAYHDPLYGDFSRLVESTFDDALDDFADGSIDLLHIDGFHTYEAVRHDFETWQPKMSKRGIVLFHDT